jgi:hypothetical protein
MGFANMARKILRDMDAGKDTSLRQATQERGALQQSEARSHDRPYLDSDGSLVIPFGSDRRYHWWLGSHCVFTNAMGSGQSIEETMKEITDGTGRS